MARCSRQEPNTTVSSKSLVRGWRSQQRIQIRVAQNKEALSS